MKSNLIIDWSIVCNNLRHHYKSLSKVADEVCCEPQTLTRLARGDVKEISFSVGFRLIDLHYEHCESMHAGILNEKAI